MTGLLFQPPHYSESACNYFVKQQRCFISPQRGDKFFFLSTPPRLNGQAQLIPDRLSKAAGN